MAIGSDSKMSASDHKTNMWAPFKDLYNAVELTVLKHKYDLLPDLENLLKKHRSNFICLLKNPGKSTDDRNLLQKAISEPVLLPGWTGPQTLPQSMVDESLIFSDIFSLNELVSLSFILAGEQQAPRYPGLSRGLVAVLLYYDARRCIVTSLRMLIQARKGFSWTLEINEDLQSIVTKYTDRIMGEGLVDRILILLRDINIDKEVELLQQNLALGRPKHRRQVLDLMKDVRQTLADILFNWAAQSGISSEDNLKLVQYLSDLEPEVVNGVKQQTPLDDVNLTIFMTFLYSIDVSLLQRDEEGEELVKQLPLLAESNFIPALHSELSSKTKTWKWPELQAAARFAWSLTLATLRSGSNNVPQGIIDDDETVMDLALKGNALTCYANVIVANKTLYKEEFFQRRLHAVVTDFLVQIPLRVRDLRNAADEAARTILVYQQEGLEPPLGLSQDFQSLLQLITRLYEEDPLNLELCLDYWSPTDSTVAPSLTYRTSQRQASLFKFVRLAGDLLPPSLYIGYVHMLSSLANGPRAAHHAFNLLKQNGMGQGSLVSWDHFFSSLNRYYSNLRQEALPVIDTIYRHRGQFKGIVPQEVEGLMEVLRLTRTIAEHDEIARLTLCENPAWLPLVVILGLLGCSVPLHLKARLLSTMAALARSPEVAQALWPQIEAAQLLATIPSTSNFAAKSIQADLEEVESRAEEYPLTRAFLHFLYVMTDVPVPSTLGAMNRTPGFDPYLLYVKDVVFLRFHTRAYRNAAEKWEVSSLCLELLHKLLEVYEPTPEDLPLSSMELHGGVSSTTSKPPGYHLLVQCLHDSSLLRMLLMIIEEGANLLEQYTNIPGQSHVEGSSLLCLQMLSTALKLQDSFLELVRLTGASLRVMSLDSLLLSINARTGKPDHMLYIVKYLTFGDYLPAHALAASQILLRIARSPISQAQLLALYTNTTDLANLVRHGFVEAMDLQLPEETEGDNEMKESQLRSVVLQLLLEGSNLPGPSLAHFLLGFDINKPLAKTNLQQSGILGFPRTCLHAVLDLLDNALETRSWSLFPQAVGLAYKLLYLLCSNPATADVVLRYLRSCQNFVVRHVTALPFSTDPSRHELGCMACLMKLCAIEVKFAADKGLQSQLVKLVGSLIEMEEAGETRAEFGFARLNQSSVNRSVSQTLSLAPKVSRTVRPKILTLLGVLDVETIDVVPPELEFFDPSQVETAFKEVEYRNAEGTQLVRLRPLQKRLREELAVLQGMGALGQRQIILEEIQNILEFAAQRNTAQQTLAARYQYLDGWRQVLVILLSCVPSSVLPADPKTSVLMQTAQELVKKALSEKTVPQLANTISEALLAVLASLRASVMTESMGVTKASNESFISLLDGSTRHGIPGFQGTKPSAALTAPWQSIVKGLVDWILKTGGASQRVRINLYGALLNALRLEGSSQQFSATLLKNYGHSLLTMVARDACSGHDVQRMLALSVLDQLASHDQESPVVGFLSSEGYLRYLADAFLAMDETLTALVTGVQASPDLLRVLYVYESQMALLTRLGSKRKGAQHLLDNNILARLSEMSVFGYRPEISSAPAMGMHSLIPSTVHCFHQVFFAALKTCLAVLTALGSQHRVAAVQVLSFLLTHSETVNSILRARRFPVDLAALEEVSLLTGVICEAAAHDWFEEEGPEGAGPGAVELRGQVGRLQQHCLALLPLFTPGDILRHELEAYPDEHRQSATNTTLQITANILSLSVALTGASAFSNVQAPKRIIFGPYIGAGTRDVYASRDVTKGTMAGSKQLSLSVLIQILQGTTSWLQTAQAGHTSAQHRLEAVPEMGSQELVEVLPNGFDDQTPINLRKALAGKKLQEDVVLWKAGMERCAVIIESAAWLLWRHLEFFLQNRPLLDASSDRGLRREMGFNPEELKQLQADAGLYINNQLFHKLESAEQMYLKKRAHHGFLQAVLRRLKKLVLKQ